MRRLLFQQSRLAMVILEQSGRVREANQSFADQLGYSLQETGRLSCLDWQASDISSDLTAQRVRSAIHVAQFFEARHRRKDGSEFDVEISTNPVPVDGETLIYATVRDISARKNMENALRESEARERARAMEIETIMSAIPVSVVVAHDPECSHLTGNSTAYKFRRQVFEAGYPLLAAAGEPAAPRLMKDGAELPFEAWPVVRAAHGETIESSTFDLLYPDGSVRNLMGNAVPLPSDDGSIRGGVAAFLDVTEFRQLQEGLLHARTAESITTLAGGIAHDFNNLLTVIIGYAGMLESKVPEQLRSGLLAIRKSGEEAAALTRQLLAYAGKSNVRSEALDLSEHVQRTRAMLLSCVSAPAELYINLAPDLPPFECDRGHLDLVIRNLVLNAAEAIGAGKQGSIYLRTSMREVDSQKVRDLITRTHLGKGVYLVLEVEDTGCGMSAETRSRIFDPFFSTKSLGRGLGLAAVAGIMKSWHGGIEVETEPGHGTTFRVFLPAMEHPAASPRVARVRLEGLKTILLVDDEPMVRELTALMLEGKGYKVQVAGDGLEALRIFEASPQEFDLVVCDMTMPGKSGKATLEAMHAIRPELPAVLMSGYSESALGASPEAHAEFAFLRKPFAEEALMKAIRTAIA